MGSDGRVSRIALIAGPTASGKSALALGLAERLGGIVVNADSMQVYRELRILTARPNVEEETRVPHRLYGHASAAEDYSVGRWLKEVAAVLDREARPVIVVGGTGLYFRALTKGLADVPPVPEEVRLFWRKRAASLDDDALHEELAQRDPLLGGRLERGDRQRLIRALEVFEATGRSLASWRAEPHAPPLADQAARRLVLDLPRPTLYARIDARAEAMIRAGAVEEVRALLAMGLDPAQPAMKALGVAELSGVSGPDPLSILRRGSGLPLSGGGNHSEFAADCSSPLKGGRLGGGSGAAPLLENQALEALRMNTRRYAKRQITWFRGQMEDWPRLAADQPPEALILQALRLYEADPMKTGSRPAETR